MGFPDEFDAAIELFRTQYSSKFGVLSERVAAERLQIGFSTAKKITVRFLERYGGVITDYRTKEVMRDGRPIRVREFCSASIVNIKKMVEEYLTLAVKRDQINLKPGEDVVMLLYHDAANSLPGGRKLDGFFLHFLQMKAPGSVPACLPFAILHGKDIVHNLRTLFAPHEVKCAQILAKGAQEVSFDVHRALYSLRDGVTINGNLHGVRCVFYGDYHAVEVSLKPPVL